MDVIERVEALRGRISAIDYDLGAFELTLVNDDTADVAPLRIRVTFFRPEFNRVAVHDQVQLDFSARRQVGVSSP